MAFHVQLARLRAGGGNFSAEDLRVVLLEVWDRLEALTPRPVPPPPPVPDDPYGGRRASPKRGRGVEAP